MNPGEPAAQGRERPGEPPIAPAKEEAPSHPLESLAGLSPGHIELLKSRWIESVEALVGAGAAEASHEALAKLLDVRAEQMAAIMAQARAVLGDAAFAEKSTPKRGGRTGALLTEEQERQFGQP